MTNFLDRTLNSTISLPWQVMMRMIRAGMDPEKDLFSKDGLIDPALLPVAGMFFNHDRDASSSDFIDNPWLAFGADVALDPATYLGGGLTVAAKGARNTQKLLRSGPISKAMKHGEINGATSVDDLMAMAEDTLKKGAFKDKRDLKLLRLGGGLEEFKGMSLDDLLSKSKDSELAIGIPGLARLGLQRRVLPGQTSWLKVAATANSNFWRLPAMALGPVASKVPVLSGITKGTANAYDAFKHGVKKVIEPAQYIVRPGGADRDAAISAMEVMRFGGAGSEVTDGMPKDIMGRVVDLEKRNATGIKEQFAKALEVTDDPATAILIAMGRGVSQSSEANQMLATRYMKVLTGRTGVDDLSINLPRSGDEFTAAFDNFEQNMADAAEIVDNERIIEKVDDPTAALAKGEPAAGNKYFDAGQKVRKSYRKLFQSDFTAENLGPFEKVKRDFEASAQERVQALTKQFAHRRPEAAKEMFGDVPDANKLFDGFIRNIFESSLGDVEVRERVASFARGDATPEDLIADLETFISRADASVRGLVPILKKAGFKGANDISSGLVGLDKASFTVRMARESERAILSGKLPKEVVEGPAVNFHRVEYTGGSQSPNLVHMDDNALNVQSKRLERKAAVEAPPGQVNSVIESSEELMLIRDELKLDEKQMLSKMRSRIAGKKTRGMSEAERELMDEALAKLSPQDLATVDGRSTVFDLSKLSVREADDLEALREVRELRKSGKTKMYSQSDAPIEGIREVGETLPLDPGSMNDKNVHEFVNVFYRMAALTGEGKEAILRTSGTGRAAMSDNMIEQFLELSSDWDSAVFNLAEEAGGESTKAFLKGMRSVQSELAEGAFRSGLIDSSSFPFGYLPRIGSGAMRNALKKLGNSIPPEVAEAIAPQRGAEFVRALDRMSIDEINEVHTQLLKKNRPDLAKAIEGVLAEEGLTMAHYEENPVAAMMNALGASEDARSNADWLNMVMKNHGGKVQMMSGKIIGYVDDAGAKQIFGQGRKLDFDIGPRHVTPGLAENQPSRTLDFQSALIEGADGKVTTLPMTMVGNGFTMVGMGNRSKAVFEAGEMLPTGAIAAERTVADDAGSAFAHMMAAGKQNEAYFSGNAPTLQQLSDMNGHTIMFGNEANIGSVLNSTRITQIKIPEVMRALDSTNFIIRKFQTVLRPAFNVANMVSGMFQSAMLGTSVRHIIGGHLDAMRFLTDDTSADLIKFTNRHSALLGEAGVESAGIFKSKPGHKAHNIIAINEATRIIGRTGKPLTVREAEELGLSEFMQKTWRSGDGQVISGAEILNVVAQEQMLGGFVQRGFAGTPVTPASINRVIKDAEDIAAGGVKGKAKDLARQGNQALELSESSSRWAAFFGRLREGSSLRVAAQETKEAFVDYGQLTKAERIGKRAITYYPFARHYVPFFLKQVGTNPGMFQQLGAAVRNSGAITVANGQTELKVGDHRIAMQRLNANIDAMTALPAIAERIYGAGRGEEDIDGAAGVPSFLGIGGVAGIVTGADDFFTADSNQPRKDWMTNAMMSTFASKWLYQGVTGKGDGFLDELTKFALPVREVDPKHEQRVMIRNFQKLLSQIKFEAEDASPRRRKILMEEADQLGSALTQALSEEE